jgi:deferrochelatase/peroxidase EfeB
VIHAVIVRYTDGPEPFATTKLATAVGAAADVVHSWAGARPLSCAEPFGFRDGISDPVIEGSGQPVTDGNGAWDGTAWRAARTAPRTAVRRLSACWTRY